MKYALITTDGDLHIKDGTWAEAIGEVGPHGWDGFPIHQVAPHMGMRGHVSDVGHVMPDIYPRNVVGSLVVVSLGAAIYPYAGPIVVSGFERPHDDDPDVTGLIDHQADMIRVAHADVRHALNGDPAPEQPADWAPGQWETWSAMQTELADAIRTAPTPVLTMGDGS